MVLAKTAYQRYCQNHYFKCDDSWAYGHGGSSGNTIFNITKNYGYSGYNCCGGGGFWSGFGKGLGWGFGQGIMSFLSSFTPWNCGWMNWSTFAGSHPSMQFDWGNVFGTKKSKKEEKEEKPATTTTTTTPASTTTTASTPTTIEKLNKDYPTLIALHDRKVDLLNPNRTTPATATELQKLLSDIEAMEVDGKLDGIDDSKDKQYIADLKAGLQAKIDSLTDSAPVTPVNGGGNESDDLSSIGVTDLDDGTCTLPNKMTVENLKKLAKSGKIVSLAYNSRSNMIDPAIQGKISNVTENNGKISFDIDCNNDKSTYKYKYKVEQADNGKWKISYISGYKTGDGELYTRPCDGYTFNSTTKRLETNSEQTVIRTKEKYNENGVNNTEYQKLEEKEA